MATGTLLRAIFNYLLLHSFNTLIDSFIDKEVGVAENFLNDILAGQLAKHLVALYADDRLRAAGIGNNESQAYDQTIRSDKILWLDRENSAQEEIDFFTLMDHFVRHLNSTCYTGITGYEFHYALYEAGSFYKKHLDQFRNNNSRKYSMILYLNEGWQEADGGQLCVYGSQGSQKIAPELGKGVFFKSDVLPHEVLLAHKPRMSITGWLKVD